MAHGWRELFDKLHRTGMGVCLEDIIVALVMPRRSVRVQGQT